jgi:DUF4097 and DUF4098 domain-containing protein YvlB
MEAIRHSWRRFYWLFPALLCPLLGGCLDSGGNFVELATVRQTRPMPESTRSLRLSTSVGNILVTPGDDLRIEAVVKANPGKVEIEKANKTFDAHVRVTESEGALQIADAHMDAPDRDAWQVELRVTVPRAVALAASTGVGDVNLGTAAGDVVAKTGVGNVKLAAESVESAELGTGVGSVTADIKSVAGDLQAKSGTGHVSLRLGSVRGSTEAASSAGNVTVAISAAPKKDVKATTGVGDVTLKLPAGAQGKFSGITKVGSAKARGLPGVNVKKAIVGSSLSGTTGEGPSYEVTTGTGDITIEAE